MIYMISRSKALIILKVVSEYDFSAGYNPKEMMNVCKLHIPIKLLLNWGLISEYIENFQLKYKFNSECLEDVNTTISKMLNLVRVELEENMK